MTDTIPEGYAYAPSPSAFPNHVGRLFHKKVPKDDGDFEMWTAIRIESHHVNSWGMAHGGFIAFLAEVATAGAAWDPEGPPVVTISLTTQFIRAPKEGQLLEIRAHATRRTRSLVFVDAEAVADGNLQFTVTAVNKVIGGG